MGLFGYFSYTEQSETVIITENSSDPVSEPDSSQPPIVSTPSASTPNASHPEPLSPKDIPLPSSPPLSPSSPASAKVASEQPNSAPTPKRPKPEIRRFSFRTPLFLRTHEEHKSALTTIQDHEKKAHAAKALSKRLAKPLSSKSDKRAKESAFIVHSLIVGPPSSASPIITKSPAKSQLNKVKAQLMQPKSANKLIAQLRVMSVSGESVDGKDGGISAAGARGPIHAVCLTHTDAEEQQLLFAHLKKDGEDQVVETTSLDPSSVATASVDKLTRMFSEMHIVNLLKSPDLGIGQAGDGDGLLAGAVPTAETVINGIEQITPQLMALGYATGRAMAPDHKGVFPPTDRMSVLTYWWGLEIALPPPSLEYLNTVHSISSTVVNSLSALALINNGVREILPFVRYIGQFMDFEFDAIRKQDHGQGVVCASTWIMPAALVPRPWDFPLAPSDLTAKDDASDRPSKGSAPIHTALRQGVAHLPISALPQVVITSPTSSTVSVPSHANKAAISIST